MGSAAAVVMASINSDDRRKLIDELFADFIREGSWPNSDQFDIDHHAEIALIDGLKRADAITNEDGNLEPRIALLPGSSLWSNEGRRANAVLRRITELYKTNREKMWPASELANSEDIPLNTPQVQRSLWYISKAGLLGGYQKEGAVFSAVRASSLCLRFASIEDKMQKENQYQRLGRFLGARPPSEVPGATLKSALPPQQEAPNIVGLHPFIVAVARKAYELPDFREAVLKAFIAVFDHIRERAGRSDDGETLITHTFSLGNPILRLNSLKTESDRNEQIGFMEMLRGAYKGIRNPKAHTLKSKTMPPQEAFECLAMASFMMRKVDSATRVRSKKTPVKQARSPVDPSIRTQAEGLDIEIRHANFRDVTSSNNVFVIITTNPIAYQCAVQISNGASTSKGIKKVALVISGKSFAWDEDLTAPFQPSEVRALDWTFPAEADSPRKGKFILRVTDTAGKIRDYPGHLKD